MSVYHMCTLVYHLQKQRTELPHHHEALFCASTWQPYSHTILFFLSRLISPWAFTSRGMEVSLAQILQGCQLDEYVEVSFQEIKLMVHGKDISCVIHYMSKWESQSKSLKGRKFKAKKIQVNLIWKKKLTPSISVSFSLSLCVSLMHSFKPQFE